MTKTFLAAVLLSSTAFVPAAAWAQAPPAQPTGAAANANQARPGATREIRVGALTDLNVYNARGEMLGDIECVVVNPADNRQYVITGHGGFLGRFEDQVALPLNRLVARGDRVMIRGITDAEPDALPNWRQQYANARDIGGNQTVSVSFEQ